MDTDIGYSTDNSVDYYTLGQHGERKHQIDQRNPVIV